MSIRPVRIALALLACSALLASAAGAQAPEKIRVTVVAVKASPAGEGVSPGVGEGLDKVASKLQRLPFARFEAESTTSKELAAGDKFVVPFGGSGRFVIAAVPAGDGVELEVQEFAPGSDAPCLSSRSKVEPGRTQVSFCDGVPSKAQTLVFLSSVQRP